MQKIATGLVCGALVLAGFMASIDDTRAQSAISKKGETISAAKGGVVVSSDERAKLTIPPEALAKDTAITIAPKSATHKKVRSGVYELGPDRLAFKRKVELCLTAATEDEVDDLCLGYLDGKGEWKCEDPCLEAKDGQLCGHTTHFTSFAILLSGTGSSRDVCDDDD